MGSGGPSLDQIAERFETSRAQSGGLGLGLATMIQILCEHVGNLHGRDSEDVDAVFEMRPRRAEPEA